MNQKTKTIVAGALGECVHVAGVTNFLRLAEWSVSKLTRFVQEGILD